MNNDINIVRELAKKVKNQANTPRMEALKSEWKRHNALKGVRPLICVSPEGAWREIIPDSSLECTGDVFRKVEFTLKAKLYWATSIKDDTPISDYLNVPWHVNVGSYGVSIEKDTAGGEGSFKYREPIGDIDRDFHKLKFRDVSVDRENTVKELDVIGDALGDILNVRIRGTHWWTLGITSEVIKLIGLSRLMLLMYDNPNGLHKLMAFLRDEHLSYINYLQTEGLLCLNNEDDLIASGGIGYTDELPTAGFDGKVRFKDMWGFAESQETVGISPDMFSEYIFPYQLALLECFGINCYGCCEAYRGGVGPMSARYPD